LTQTEPIFNLDSCSPQQTKTRRKKLPTEGKIYFISDAHLGEDISKVEKSKEERLIAFLRHIAQDAAFLYVVGDLFDFWFEYKQAVPARHHRVLHRLD